MTSSSNVSAVILAAGMSRRMGIPKQLLRLGEKSLLEHVLANVRASHAAEIVLVLGFEADSIQRQLVLEGVRMVVNPNFEQGMGGSLRLGLSAVSPLSEAALIVLADQPLVLPETFDRLIEHHQRLKPQIVLPTYKGFRGNPVLLDRSVFPELMSLSGDVGCRAIFGSHQEGILKVPVDDAGILLDIDTLDDLDKACRAGNRLEAEGALLAVADMQGRELRSGPLVFGSEKTPGEATPTPGEAIPQAISKEKQPVSPELIVVGRDAVARALAKLGHAMNFSVTIVDPFLTLGELEGVDKILRVLDFSVLPPAAERFVVVASQGKFDEEGIEQAVKAKIGYIALLANRSRAQEVLRSLESKSVPPEILAAVKAPAGIDIGAESPEEIALSILAEIVRERRVVLKNALKQHS
ncbi:MAG TPA: NTP transferase domain-containing protein [Candidatus Angelobacter sp.]|nr:NTP transferase domain-containing protein [Candidatus Angelobacter sp.]